MMVLVDTTVWIDFFAGRAVAHVARLEQLIGDDADLCTCGIVLTEVLQGIRVDKDYQLTLLHFDAMQFLPMSRETFVLAWNLYRKLRRDGVTIRKSVDCMIAAVAIEHGAVLLHNDRDFDAIASGSGLKAIRQ